MFFLAGFWDKVGSAIMEALRSLMLSLCEVIYKFIVFFYDIFMMLGNASILDDSVIQEIYHRVGLILGLFMVFRVVFSLIQYVMNPDMMLDKQKGVFNIVKKMFIVVVLLGTTPYLFDLAYDAQILIIDSNIIPKVITGKNTSSEDFGSDLAWYTFSSFYKFDVRASDSDKNKCDVLKAGILKSDFTNNGSLDYAFNCVNEKVLLSSSSDDEKEYFFLIDFEGHGLVAVLVGAVVLWMIVMYVIQVGVRVVQLAYLELIAPIPIIGYLAPKGDDTFNKWVKQCTTTYLDFFMRVGIIYLVIFIVQLLMSNDGNHFEQSLGNTGAWDLTWIKLIMIIALLIFAKKVPNLIKELFPMAGGAAKFSMGLNPKKEVLEPLKQMYNTPLGWAPKALGWAGRKTIGAIDRKVHNLPKPRNKFQQSLDKLAPGYAEAAKQKSQAMADASQWEKQSIRGKEIYDSVGGELAYPDGHPEAGKVKNGVFKNQAYVNSWNEKSAAKGEVKKAEKLIDDINDYITNTRYSNSLSDSEKKTRIDLAKKELENAKKNLSAAEGKLKIASERHEKNQKIYTKDAETERLFNNYADTHKKAKTVNVGNLPDFGVVQNAQSVQQQTSQQKVQQSTAKPTSQQPVQQKTNEYEKKEGQYIKPEDIYVSEKDIEDAYSQLYDLTGSGASKDEVNEQLQWIDTLSKENEKNLEDAYQHLYDLTSSGASQEEIDAQIKKVNDIKSGEIKQ